MTGAGIDLLAAGRLVGEHRWLELQVFELSGAWVTQTADRGAKLTLDRHSGHSVWRAGQLEERLPVLAGVDRPSLVQPPDDQWVRCLKQLSMTSEPVARLAGLYRVVLPRLAGRYRAHLAASSPVADGPTRRTLRMVLDDVTNDCAEGADTLVRLLVDPASVETAAGALARLEVALLP